MFSTFGGTKRREPLFTFKRKPVEHFNNEILKKPLEVQSYDNLLIPTLEQLDSKNISKPDPSFNFDSPKKSNEGQQYNDLLIPTLEELYSKKSVNTATANMQPSSSYSSSAYKESLKPDIAASDVNSTTKESVKATSTKVPVELTKRTNSTEPAEFAEDDSIFDFPDSTESFSEIKVMVASSRTVPEEPKLKRKKSKTSNKKSKEPKANTKSIEKQQTSRKKSIATNKQHAISSQPLQPIMPLMNSQSTSQPPYSSTSQSSLQAVPQPSNYNMPQVNSQTIPPPIVQSQNSFDIFDFDPDPTSFSFAMSAPPINIQNNNVLPNTPTYNYSQYNTINMYSAQDMYNTTPMYNLAPQNHLNTSNNHQQVSIASLLNDEFQLAQVTNFFNMNNTVYNENTLQTMPTSSLYKTIPIQTTPIAPKATKPPAPVEKKRKRNLVAHLKTATGEKDTKPKNKGFDFLSDEEEAILAESKPLPLQEVITNKERSLSPELTYAERMELELEAVMKSEFGKKSEEKENTPTTTERRQRYQPLNKLNVRVTFEKK